MTACIYIMQLLLLVIGCSLASAQDIKTGKIENKLVAFLCISGVVANIILFMVTRTIPVVEFASDSVVVILLSVVLYFTHIWAGGDAKLAIAIALLYPYSFLMNTEKYRFELWWFLVFAFGMGFIYLLAESLILFIRKKVKVSPKEAIHAVLKQMIQYLKTIIYITALNYLYLYFVAQYYNAPFPLHIVLCLLFVWITGRFKIFKSKILITAFAVFDIGAFIITRYLTVSTNLYTYLIVAIFIIIRFLTEKFNYETIKTESVKKGMVLSRVSSLAMQNSRVIGLPTVSNETLSSRLTESEADSIKRWAYSKNGQENIVIVKKIPFAIFISLGLLVYTIIGRFILW